MVLSEQFNYVVCDEKSWVIKKKKKLELHEKIVT